MERLNLSLIFLKIFSAKFENCEALLVVLRESSLYHIVFLQSFDCLEGFILSAYFPQGSWNVGFLSGVSLGDKAYTYLNARPYTIYALSHPQTLRLSLVVLQ